ncbi:hypothetical protein IWQ60_010619 [Tieghemiomyces parasiticus]|uniref:DUF8032 domain-containing protein n=1 Tax=Tieghemiomyces parasiticus TaxID=78921 RepID=A0A9W7ZJA6_9FUNG|nr:hypothetical protein IWQ60_010619 [Tieghemiomyces parasiticus]
MLSSQSGSAPRPAFTSGIQLSRPAEAGKHNVPTPVSTPTAAGTALDLNLLSVASLRDNEAIAEQALVHFNNDQLARLSRVLLRLAGARGLPVHRTPSTDSTAAHSPAGALTPKHGFQLSVSSDVAQNFTQLHLQAPRYTSVGSDETIHDARTPLEPSSAALGTLTAQPLDQPPRDRRGSVHDTSGSSTPTGQKRKATDLGDESTAVLGSQAFAQMLSQSSTSRTPTGSPAAALVPVTDLAPVKEEDDNDEDDLEDGDLDDEEGAGTDLSSDTDETGPTNPTAITTAAASTKAPDTKPGPPRIIETTIDGVQWIQFYYTTKGVTTEFNIRIDIESVNLDELSVEFRRQTAIYPRAYVPQSQYQGNRWAYETECNRLSWALAHLNPLLSTEKRGVLQRAVDSYRNRNPSLRSRRVMRQEKLKNGTLRKRSSSKDAYAHSQTMAGLMGPSGMRGYFGNPMGAGSLMLSSPLNPSAHNHPGYHLPETANRFNRKKSASVSVGSSNSFGGPGPLTIHTGPDGSVPQHPYGAAFGQHRRAGSIAQGFPVPGSAGFQLNFGNGAHSQAMCQPYSPALMTPGIVAGMAGPMNSPSAHFYSQSSATPATTRPFLPFAEPTTPSTVPLTRVSSHDAHFSANADSAPPSSRRRATMVESELHRTQRFPVEFAGAPSPGFQFNSAPNGVPSRLSEATRMRANSMSVLPSLAEDVGTPLTPHFPNTFASGPSNPATPTQQAQHLQVPVTINGQAQFLPLRVDIASVPAAVLTTDLRARNALFALDTQDSEQLLLNEISVRLVVLNCELDNQRDLLEQCAQVVRNHLAASSPGFSLFSGSCPPLQTSVSASAAETSSGVGLNSSVLAQYNELAAPTTSVAEDFTSQAFCDILLQQQQLNVESQGTASFSNADGSANGMDLSAYMQNFQQQQ